MGKFNEFCDLFEEFLSVFATDHRKLVLCGDWNIHFENPNSSECKKFSSLISPYGLILTVGQKTRQNSILDNILINFSTTNFKMRQFDPGFSDHGSQVLTVQTSQCTTTCDRKVIKSRPITESRKNSFYNIVKELDWSYVDRRDMDINTKFKVFQTNISDAANIAFPEQSKTLSKQQKTTFKFTNELKSMRSELQLISELYSCNPTEDLAERRGRLRSIYRKKILEAKQSKNDNLIKKSSNPSKTMWDIIKSHQSKTKEDKTNLTPDDLNDNFCDAPSNIVNNLPPASVSSHVLVSSVNVAHVDEEFYFLPVTQDTIHDAMFSLTRKKGRDFFGLNLELILTVHDLITPVFAKLVNFCLEEGIFPDCLKIGLIHPIFKKGDVNTPSNWRPVQILPVMSKIVEKVLSDQITSYFNYFNLFSPNQFGFRKSLSTTDAVEFFNRFISSSFDKKLYLHATLCDLSRAFECLSHSILNEKLKHYKFNNSSSKLMSSYLEGRCQQVKLGDVISNSRSVSTGIPTGSILGPLLFLIYINDLPVNLPHEANEMIFADDTTLFVQNTREENLLAYSKQVLERAQVWFTSNRLHLNASKTQEMVFSLRQTSFPNPSFVKLLGFYVDPQLRWHAHIDYVAGKLSGRLFLLKQLKHQVSLTTLKNAYYGLLTRLQRETIESDARIVFEDVNEEFSLVERVVAKFARWKKFEPDQYGDAYVSLCLSKILGPFVRFKILFWNPLTQPLKSLEQEAWYQSLLLYGLDSSETEESLVRDPDVMLLPKVVEKVILTKIEGLVKAAYDPLSTSQTVCLIGTLSKLLQDFPTLDGDCKILNCLLEATVDKLRNAVDDDVFIPIYMNDVESGRTSMFFQRQFASAVKLLGNIVRWQGLLSNEIVIQIGIDSLLNRYLILGLRTFSDPLLAAEKCKM
ncbi:hypothetical protein WDU94_000665, partial [Cyamophila willieti]